MNAPLRHEGEQLVRFTPGMRRLIADAIEALILLLDEIDGDPDLEEDEPAEEGDDELDDADKEPSLGAPESHPITSTLGGRGDQTHWADGGMRDLEWDGDDREPDVDSEPRCEPFTPDQSKPAACDLF